MKKTQICVCPIPQNDMGPFHSIVKATTPVPIENATNRTFNLLLNVVVTTSGWICFKKKYFLRNYMVYQSIQYKKNHLKWLLFPHQPTGRNCIACWTPWDSRKRDALYLDLPCGRLFLNIEKMSRNLRIKSRWGIVHIFLCQWPATSALKFLMSESVSHENIGF